jgi:hypothetical protein
MSNLTLELQRSLLWLALVLNLDLLVQGLKQLWLGQLFDRA